MDDDFAQLDEMPEMRLDDDVRGPAPLDDDAMPDSTGDDTRPALLLLVGVQAGLHWSGEP